VGISITELSVIFIVALLLFGPEQLPTLARTVGKLTGQLKKTSDSLRRDFYNSVYPPGEDIKNALNGELRSLRALKAEVLSPPTGAVGSPSRPSSPQLTERGDSSAESTPGASDAHNA
jgi:TatA/E family protein of Tat protein translocase